jgi:tetratricopeptide (TPR) repeat protein
VITVALCLALVCAPEPAGSDDNPHFATAVAAWKDKRWPEAADAFARAYELDPRPEYVFARAQALRFAGECEPAIAAYREFIDLAPPQAAIDEARGHIATCGGVPEPAPAPAPEPPPRIEPTPVVEPPPPSPEPPKRWWRDAAGHALTWTGVAIAATGGGLLGEAFARRRRGEQAGTEESYRDARRGGATLWNVGIPLLAAGGALVLGGIIRFVVVAHPPEKRARARRSARERHRVVPLAFGIAWSP